MDHNDKVKQIEDLADKAAKATKSEDALRFSQSACNLVHVLQTLEGKYDKK
jgi:hypothetical protein